MNNKKIQAQMQINVSFLGDTSKLLKQLQDTTKDLKLDSSLYKPLATELSKGFKEAFDVFNQMATGLSKKGLSTKQYTDFFNNIHAKFTDVIHLADNLKKHLSDAFNSPENKQALKNLQAYRSQLEAIQKIATKQKAANTRKGTAIQGFKDATGLDYELAGGDLTRIRDKLANNKKLRKDDWAWIADSGLTDTNKLQEAFHWLERIEKTMESIAKYDVEAGAINETKSVAAALSKAEKQIASVEKTVISPELNKQNLAIATSAEAAAKSLRDEAEALGPKFLGGALPEAERQAKATAIATSTLKEVFAQFGIHFSAASVIKGFIDLLKNSFEFYKSLDSALNEIYVVSSLSIDKVNELQQSFLNMAKTTGMALDDVTRAAVLFYQQGLNTDEVLEMTRVTAQFAKVAGIDATDAADKLTAAVNGYRLSAQDAMSVADKFNKVAAASAADINELSTAFSKAAAQANQAGVSMDNYLAYIATMEEATREAPENLGTSLKTIFARMQQIKSGDNTEDNTDVNQVETALRSVNIALRDTNGQLRDLEDIFAELGPRWNTLDRNTQAYLGTIIAGTRQQSRFITLMQNWDRVLDLASQSENSAGQQALMHAKAMDSITSKLQQLNVAWQEFISNISNSAVFKGVISSLTKILNLLNSGNKPIAAIMLAVGLLSRKLKDFNTPLKQKKDSLFGQIGDFFKNGRMLSSKEMADQSGKQALKAQEELNKLKHVQEQLEEKVRTGQKLTQKELKTQLTIEQDIANKKEEVNRKEAEHQRLVGNSNKSLAQTVASIGTAVQALSLMIDDTNTSGLLSGLGGTAGGIGRFISGDYIGGIVQTATSVGTLIKTIADWDKNLEKKITDNVAKVQEKLTNYNNTSTEIKNTQSLIDKYNKLNSTIMKTTTQQEELNRVAQELADSYNLDVVEDDFGNLTVNMRDVEQAMKDLEEQQKNTMKELDEQEVTSLLDSLSGLFNSNTMDDFYKELYSTNRSAYRSMLSGLEDGLKKETRVISESVAKEFNNNLKSSIIREVESNAAGYAGIGQSTAMKTMEKDISGLSSSDWNSLYYELDFLKNGIETMTFQQVQDHMDEFYDRWSARTKLTEEEWKALRDSINNTVFENKSLLDFYDKVNEMQGKGSGKYYTDNINKLNKQLEDLKKTQGNLSAQQDASTYGGMLAGGLLGLGLALIPGVGLLAGGAMIAAGVAGGGFGGYSLSNTTDTKKYKAVQKAIADLEKQQKEYYKTVAENDPFLDDAEDAERYIKALGKLKDAFTHASVENANFWSGIPSAMDLSDLTSVGQREDFGAILENMMKQTEGFTNQGDRYNVFSKLIEAQINELDNSTNEYAELYKQKLLKIQEEAFNSMPTTSSISFSQLTTELDEMSKKLRSMNDVVAEFKQNKGAISLDSFANLASIIDGIDFSNLAQLKNGPKYIDQTIDAIENLNLAYDANNGMITMNGNALKSLQDIQEAQTKAALIGKINDLKANAATIKSQIALVDAQINTTRATIKRLEMTGEGELAYADLVKSANQDVQDSEAKKVKKVAEGYKVDVDNQGKWATTIINNLAKATNAWNVYYKALRDGATNVDQLYKDAESVTRTVTWGALDSNSGVDWQSHTDRNGNLVNIKGLIGELNSYLGVLENTKKQYSKSLALTEAEIKLLTNLANSDLSKLGGSKSSTGSQKDAIQVYIGQLKEIYNILNRIDMLEHRLNTLDTYADISKEKAYADLLKERLGYNQELLNQYDFLVSEQKKFTNGYKDFIGTVEGLEGVFDFDQFGQIIINWEKYINLQDTAAKGEVTLKQKADDVYETYQKMFDELKQDFDKYIKYLKNVISLLQEVIDSYNNMEAKAVSAIREIYQKILNDRLDAIDKEKKALDELQEARTRARTDQENAKTMSGLQTNLQRAMMDTSGASDSNFIKAQKDIEDKLEKIADDKYSKMLQDIQKALDEEKDALQQDFEELWENLDWLHEWLDEDIMQHKGVLVNLLQQTEEWQTASPLRRKEFLQEWGTWYETYMSQLNQGKTIFDVWDEIQQTRNRIAELDASLVQSDSKNSKEIIQTIKSWQNATDNAIKSASKSSSGGGGGSGGSGNKFGSGNQNNTNTNNKKTGDTTTNVEPLKLIERYCTISLDDGIKNYCETIKVKVGSKYTVPSRTRTGYTLTGWKCSDGKTYKPGQSITVPDKNTLSLEAVWQKQLVTSTQQYINNTKSFLSSLVPGRANGGYVSYTGLTMLHGSPERPEAVLNPLQTAHFAHFTNTLDKIYEGNVTPNITGSTVSIDNISFNVASMSSVEDGEKAFNMFVSKFKEIGNQTGIKMNNFKNTI